MKKILILTIIFCTFLGLSRSIFSLSDIEKLQLEINETQHLLDLSKNATTPLESEVQSLSARITSALNQIQQLNNDQKQKEEEIKEQEAEMADQYRLFSSRVDQQYRHATIYSPLVMLLSSWNSNNSQQAIKYSLTLAEKDKQTIEDIGVNIIELQEAKKAAAERATSLASLQKQLNDQKAFFEKEIAGAKAYQAQLQNKIAELSARQQEIINAKSGGFNVNIGDSELADDYNASVKGFREAAPGGYFAVFSFGAYSHRKGMSQYGARGRAQQGQNYKQILQAYYGKEPVDKDTNGKIKVDGQGEIDFEDKYLMGIAEMPSSWHPEALKAQAVAARTYAYRYYRNGSSICTTESCQVYSSSKANNPPEAWKQAVRDTRGKVLEDVVTYYSSTSGGWSKTGGWDTTDGGGGSNFIDKAYEKIGGSPWLYKAWYTQGYSVNSDKCGRSNPWLSPEEMADIVNAAIALKHSNGIDTGRITPVTTSCWGGNPYSMSELRDKVRDRGGIDRATSVSVSQGNGTTNSVTINGVTLSASEFREAFNVRAPGYLKIPQSSGVYGSPFFNVEKK